ncbi:MAG: Gfo/Idh/MocA family oxidoreductase [Bacillota bacterium]|nr:Gfo/Idh/MocA family oxidoreductase [Bacillota bacterium]
MAAVKRVVVAGCGSMAQEWVRYAKERTDVEIVALVDVVEAAARAFAAKQGLDVPLFRELGEAIRATGADLVFDVTIPAAHELIATTALEAGCDVLSEKPLADSMEAAGRLVHLAAARGRQYAIMQNRRYDRRIRAFRQILAEGRIGTVGMLTADFYIGAHFGGFRDVMSSPLILDMAIHTFDAARFISGADPVAVYCHEFNPPGSWYAEGASAVALFEMSDGSVFSYRGSWCAEGANTSWESSWRAVGSGGTAIWDGVEAPWYETPVEAEPMPFIRDTVRGELADGELGWSGREGHFGCLDEMFAALAERRPAETDAADNIRSLAMVFGAIESARRRERVELGGWY